MPTFAVAASAAAENVNMTNAATKSQQHAATSELDITDQTLPPKPKCKSLRDTVESYCNK